MDSSLIRNHYSLSESVLTQPEGLTSEFTLRGIVEINLLYTQHDAKPQNQGVRFESDFDSTPSPNRCTR